MKPIILIVGNAVSNKLVLEQLKIIFTVKTTDPKSLKKDLSMLKNVEVLWIHFDTFLDETYVGALNNIKLIVSTTTGVTHICPVIQAKFKNRLITLKNRKVLETVSSTAELTWALILHSNINVNEAIKSVKNGEWNRQAHLRTKQLRSQRLGIIGFGRLGRMVAQMAKGFSMKVIVYDKDFKKQLAAISNKFTVTTNVQSLLMQSDIVSIHADYNFGQEPLINLENLKLISKPFILVNTSRAGLVDEQSIIKYARINTDFKYLTDVLSFEENNLNLQRSNLWKQSLKNDRFVVTPHIGGANNEAIYICERELLNSIEIEFSKKNNYFNH